MRRGRCTSSGRRGAAVAAPGAAAAHALRARKLLSRLNVRPRESLSGARPYVSSSTAAIATLCSANDRWVAHSHRGAGIVAGWMHPFPRQPFLVSGPPPRSTGRCRSSCSGENGRRAPSAGRTTSCLCVSWSAPRNAVVSSGRCVMVTSLDYGRVCTCPRNSGFGGTAMPATSTDFEPSRSPCSGRSSSRQLRLPRSGACQYPRHGLSRLPCWANAAPVDDLHRTCT